MSAFLHYVLLRERSKCRASDVVTSWRKLFPASQQSLKVEREDNGIVGTAGGFILAIEGRPYTVIFVDEPLPTEELKEPLSLDRAWPDASSVAKLQKAHVIVARLDNPGDYLDKLNSAAIASLLAAAVAGALPSIAVVNQPARTIASSQVFIAEAGGLMRRELPMLRWLSLAFLEDNSVTPSRTGAYSYGLMPFIGRELEFVPSHFRPGEIATRMFGLAEQLMLRGLFVADGDTVGVSETERIVVRLVTQGQRTDTPLIRLNVVSGTFS